MIEVPDFTAFQKIPRLTRHCVITEKIDGTNSLVLNPPPGEAFVYKSGKVVPFLVASRNRWIQPENDNYGFAKWAYDNEAELLKLGPGHHFGEWWGAGIQRKYGMKEKVFSLFNTARWEKSGLPTTVVRLVPILERGDFNTSLVDSALDKLREHGSFAAPGFMQPEGVVIFHAASGRLFKKTLDHDELAKGQVDG